MHEGRRFAKNQNKSDQDLVLSKAESEGSLAGKFVGKAVDGFLVDESLKKRKSRPRRGTKTTANTTKLCLKMSRLFGK